MSVKLSSKAKRSLKKFEKTFASEVLSAFIEISQLNDWKQHKSVKKLTSSPFYRFKYKNIRVIFDEDGTIFVIYDVRQRNENTYKNL